MQASGYTHFEDIDCCQVLIAAGGAPLPTEVDVVLLEPDRVVALHDGIADEPGVEAVPVTEEQHLGVGALCGNVQVGPERLAEQRVRLGLTGDAGLHRRLPQRRTGGTAGPVTELADRARRRILRQPASTGRRTVGVVDRVLEIDEVVVRRGDERTAGSDSATGADNDPGNHRISDCLIHTTTNGTADVTSEERSHVDTGIGDDIVADLDEFGELRRGQRELPERRVRTGQRGALTGDLRRDAMGDDLAEVHRVARIGGDLRGRHAKCGDIRLEHLVQLTVEGRRDDRRRRAGVPHDGTDLFGGSAGPEQFTFPHDSGDVGADSVDGHAVVVLRFEAGLATGPGGDALVQRLGALRGFRVTERRRLSFADLGGFALVGLAL